MSAFGGKADIEVQAIDFRFDPERPCPSRKA
jgi:hypothetical protein